MIIAIDFDGVIHDFKNPVPGRKMGPPIPGTQAALQMLKNLGYTLIVYTAWEKGHGAIEKFMEYYDLPFDEVTNMKPAADAYIDDNAFRFTKWDETLAQLINYFSIQ